MDPSSDYAGSLVGIAWVGNQVGTTGLDTITVSFESYARSIPINAELFFEVSYDYDQGAGTGSWNVVWSIGNHRWIASSFDISAFSGGLSDDNPNFGIRFRLDGVPGEPVQIDNVIINGCSVTLAIVSSFNAYSDLSGQVVLEWSTAAEINTVGFYLDRLDDETGKYIALSDMLLPGLIAAPQGGVYRFIDKTAIPGKPYTYNLFEVETDGLERTLGPFTVTVDIDDQKLTNNQGSETVMELSTSRYSQKAHQISTAMKDRIKTRKHAYEAHLDSKSKQYGSVAKISIVDSGLYFVDALDIGSILNIYDRKIRWLIESNGLSLTNRDEKIAYLPAADNSGIYFYGEGIDSIYTHDNVYWLKQGKGYRMDVLEGVGPQSSTPYQTSTETIHAEENYLAATALFNDPETDYWFWDYIIADEVGKLFSIRTPNDSGHGIAELSIMLHGATETDHHVVAILNGVEVGEAFWSGTRPYTMMISLDSTLLTQHDNTLEVAGILDTGVPYSVFLVDSIDLSYERFYWALNDTLFCTGQKNDVITIDGFTTKNICVFDLTWPENPIIVNAITVNQTPNGYQVNFVPTAPETPYLVTKLDSAEVPASFTADKPSHLKQRWNGTDYLIITIPELQNAARELAHFRGGEVVLLEDIYDEFNDGIASPHAIRNFLDFAYKKWQIPPKYVVLAGVGSFDYKNNMGYSDNLLPVLMTRTPYGLFASDNRFVDVKGDDGVPEMAIGRLPVMTEDEVTAFIEKIATYENSASDAWSDKILMLADNPDGSGNFTVDSDNMAALLPSEYLIEKIYLSDYPVAVARQFLIEGINNGALLINYLGHSGMDRLAQEGLLRTSDLEAIDNGEKLPVMTAMTCLVGRFAIPGFDSLGVEFLLHTPGGAVAVWAPTGLSHEGMNLMLNEELFKAIFIDGEKVLGRAITKALEACHARGLSLYGLEIYTLLGDPALTIKSDPLCSDQN